MRAALARGGGIRPTAAVTAAGFRGELFAINQIREKSPSALLPVPSGLQFFPFFLSFFFFFPSLSFPTPPLIFLAEEGMR